MMLPVLDGWDFLEQFALLRLSPAPRIVVITGSSIIGLEWARAHACHGFIRKPIDPALLLAENPQMYDVVASRERHVGRACGKYSSLNFVLARISATYMFSLQV